MKYFFAFLLCLFFPILAVSDNCHTTSLPAYSHPPFSVSPGIAYSQAVPGFMQNLNSTIVHQPGAFGISILHQSQMTNVIESSPEIYMNGTYRGRMNFNRYDPDSISNPYGRYGSRYSPDSITNRYSPGNRFTPAETFHNYGGTVM